MPRWSNLSKVNKKTFAFYRENVYLRNQNEDNEE